MARKPRPAAPGISAQSELDTILRVDHAGEFGAVRIYKGQLDVLKRNPRAREAVAAVREMARTEDEHLAKFQGLLSEHRVRPTALEPFWRVAGYALGAGTALMGEKAAMACTAAVERVIDAHYAGQMARLPAGDLKDTIRKFRDEEIAHRDEALARGAEKAPFYRLLDAAIAAGCRAAIALSERI